MTIRFSVLYTHPKAGEGENISSKSISTDSQNGSLFGWNLLTIFYTLLIKMLP